jgi:hypothetical protein
MNTAQEEFLAYAKYVRYESLFKQLWGTADASARANSVGLELHRIQCEFHIKFGRSVWEYASSAIHN